MAKRATTTVNQNGNGHASLERIEQMLLDVATVGYKPSLPIDGFFGANGMPIFNFRMDIEYMLTHPTVRRALTYYKSGIAGAEFYGGKDNKNPDNEKGLPICADEEVGMFVSDMCERFWDRGVPLIQEGGYSYGWTGGENIYCIDEGDGRMKWDGITIFAPNNTFILTQDHVPVGFLVKNIEDTGTVNLFFSDGQIPAKGLWYAHNPRFNALYGQSQLLGAWRPWRRLAWKDGAETVIDGAVYRLGYQGPVVRYPPNDPQAPTGSAQTTLDSQSNPRKYNRDLARMIIEQAKAGAGAAFSSSRDQHGNYLWDLEWPSTTLQGIDGLIGYAKYLKDEITDGVGVPPELLQASDTGSGYSGRSIPMEAFLDSQQCIADRMLMLFVDQVVRPLVWWNWKKAIPFTVKVKRLLETKMKAKNQMGEQNPGAAQTPRPPNGLGDDTRNGQKADGMGFSLVTDRIREIARKAISA